jgi:inosine-uridine nucleoside N-ribohydrolase
MKEKDKISGEIMKRIIFMLIILECSLISLSISSRGDIQDVSIPIIVDVDVDTSDTNALLYLLNNPSVSIKAVTVSCGITYIDTGVDNVLKLLDYIEKDNLPVAGGSPTPLETNHTFPVNWREASINLFGVNLPPTEYQPSEKNASELLISTLTEATSPMIIIALGPLTNIAQALLDNPTIADKIERIDIMGGAVDVPGNIGNVYPQIPNYVAEWNFYIDPHAAAIVFSTIDNIRLIPLDATNDVPITAEFKAQLGTTKEAEIAKQLLTEGLFFWDELTAVAFTNPEVVILEMAHLDIVLDLENHEGETITNTSAPFNVAFAREADPLKFEELFLTAINHEMETTTSPDTDSSQTTTNGSTHGYSPVWGFLLPLFLLYRNKEKKKINETTKEEKKGLFTRHREISP